MMQIDFRWELSSPLSFLPSSTSPLLFTTTTPSLISLSLFTQNRRTTQLIMWKHVRNRFWATFLAIYAIIIAYGAWVARQPPGVFTPSQHAARVLPVFIAPALAYIVYYSLSYVFKLLDRWTLRKINHSERRLKKVLNELKDSSRYDKTLQLLKKYDPDYLPVPPPIITNNNNNNKSMSLRKMVFRGGGNSPIANNGIGGTITGAGVSSQSLASKATAAAYATVGRASSKVMPVMAQLWNHAAENLIADDPVMMELLREAKAESDMLRHRLGDVEMVAQQLNIENKHLRRRLGLPVNNSVDSLYMEDRGGTGGGTGNGNGGGEVGGGGVEDGEEESSQSDVSESHRQTLLTELPAGTPAATPAGSPRAASPRRRRGEPSGFGSPI